MNPLVPTAGEILSAILNVLVLVASLVVLTVVALRVRRQRPKKLSEAPKPDDAK